MSNTFELSRASDTYTGDQLTVAGFAASEWSFTPALRVSGGVRALERSACVRQSKRDG